MTGFGRNRQQASLDEMQVGLSESGSRRNDRGTAFDASQIKSGARVQITFKKYSGHNLVTRVIRLAPIEAPREKIAEGQSRDGEFPDTRKKK